MNDAYAAGLIDGEGCISIYRERRCRAFSLRVDIGMATKAEQLLRSMQARYGGRLQMDRAATERADAQWRWRLAGAAAAAFLQQIEPHLVLKAEQARLALRLNEIRTTLGWTEEGVERAERIWLRMRELNRRGPTMTSSMAPTGKPVALLVAGQWITPQCDLFSDLGSPTFSATWPRSASMRNGIVYERPTWAPPTSATASSSWPTPQAWDAHPGHSERVGRFGTTGKRPGGMNLADHVAAAEERLWPTPVAHDDGRTPEAHLAMKARMPGGPRHAITSLTVAIKAMEQGMWPTPTERDGSSGPGHAETAEGSPDLRTTVMWSSPVQARGALNPEWVECLQGFPIGWTATAGPPRPARSTHGSRPAPSPPAPSPPAAGA